MRRADLVYVGRCGYPLRMHADARLVFNGNTACLNGIPEVRVLVMGPWTSSLEMRSNIFSKVDLRLLCEEQKTEGLYPAGTKSDSSRFAVVLNIVRRWFLISALVWRTKSKPSLIISSYGVCYNLIGICDLGATLEAYSRKDDEGLFRNVLVTTSCIINRSHKQQRLRP